MGDDKDHSTRLALLEQAERHINKRVDGLEGNFRWVALIIIGTVLGTVLKSVGLI